MFKDSSIPEEFNKILYFSDNFIVYTDVSRSNSTSHFDVYIQYFYPSISVLHINNFKIPLSWYSNLSLVSSSGDITLIPYSYSTYSTDSDIYSTTSSRADFPSIFLVSFFLTIFFIWVFHNLTKFVHKGGILN